MTTPSLFRHRLPSFLVFLHPLLRLLDFPTTRLLSAFRAGTEGSVNRAPRRSIYDPWFLREILLVSVLVEGSLLVLGVRRTHKWVDFLARHLPPFRFIALDYSREQTALLHEQRASCSSCGSHLPSPLIDAIVGIAALRRQEHLGNSTWHAQIFWSARISRMARAR